VVWPTVLLTSKKSLDVKVFKNVIDINIYGTIYVAKYASLIMAKNQQINEQGDRGVIIMISSVAADEGLRG
jgi:NAD(P)-dependent dehydrogenase (short-subunit alcohol dehydrogenase family)